MRANKACPVVLRGTSRLELLAFEHPVAGLQLVKGTIEPGEDARAAAIRELREESGLGSTGVQADLGCWDPGFQGQIWSFHVCEVPGPLPERWTHATADGGGHEFRFFWHVLAETPDDRWHELFQGALAFLRRALVR